MLKRLTALMLCLLTVLPLFAVRAEEPTTLRFAYELKGLPTNLSWTVYTGPGEQYHVATGGKAKVSSNGAIMCYGRVEGTDWLLVRYFVSAGNSRIGYICVSSAAYAQTFAGVKPLHFRNEIYSLEGRVEITDDPNLSKRAIGTVSGLVTLLAIKDGGGWAYVEGSLDKGGKPVRGFIPLTALNGAAILPDVAMSPFAGDRFQLEKSVALNLADGATDEEMVLYPLADGSWLIAYRCAWDGKLYLRVISQDGKKLWAKSVKRLYTDQIILTDTGFICETFDNSECDSGTRYTYACKGKKWASRKVEWISEPDRAYADNTASFTLLRHTFTEGGQPMPIEITNRENGMAAQSTIDAFTPFLYELDGELLLLDEWHDGLTLRRFASNLTERTNLPVPEGISAPKNIHTADHARNAVYFFTGYGTDWRMWRLDRETLTFGEVPATITLPYGCTGLIALSANAAGMHDVLLQSVFGSFFCQLTADGTLLMHQALPGKVVWITRLPDARLMLVLQDSEGEFHLQYYNVSEG
ncbi:MAG: hypothetical protein IKK57_08070 [Clostridia bacterium]|nr:hypothetical protein [Clostridia bacterium]